jgi:hypothetical protein
MRATKGYLAGMGTTTALIGAIGCAFAILSAAVAVHGLPLTLGDGMGVVTLDGGPAPPARASLLTPGLLGRVSAAAAAAAPARRGHREPPAAAPGRPGVVAREQSVPALDAPAPRVQPGTPAPRVQSGASPPPRPAPPPSGGGASATPAVGRAVTRVASRAGSAVTQAGQHVGGTVQGATQQVGSAVGQVSPAAGQTAAQVGQVADGVVSGATGTVGRVVTGAGTAVGGLLGGSGGG